MRIDMENGYIRYWTDDVNENELVIDLVQVYEKRQGTGTQLVQKVIDIATEEGKELTLCAYPQDDSISLEALVEFYEGLGFSVEYDYGETVMMRY